jgi:hypothetical protein
MDAESHRQFVDRLLAQETPLSEAQLDEYRRTLQQRLTKATRQERRMRAVTLGMFGVALFGYLAFCFAATFSARGSARPNMSPFADMVLVVIAAVYFGCVICSVPFLLIYFLHYKPKVRQLQQEQLLATLSDLKQQIAELRSREPPGAK